VCSGDTFASAPIWATGVLGPFANPLSTGENASRRNHFTVLDAREAMWRALTGYDRALTTKVASGETARRGYWATAFRALGDVHRYAAALQERGMPCLVGRSEDLAAEPAGQQILALTLDDERRRDARERAQAYVATALSLAESTAPLRAWAQRPVHAPDHLQGAESRVSVWECSARAIARWALWSVAGLDQ
jgi:hypothetical protein